MVAQVVLHEGGDEVVRVIVALMAAQLERLLGGGAGGLEELGAQLARQDLDPLSVEELRARIEALEAEILRVKNKLDGSLTFRAQADTLFRKG